MIRYFTEDVKFVLKDKMANNRWLKMVAGSEIRKIGDINIIFCSDNYILDVNMRYLQHDYFTDIKPDLHIEVRKDGDFSMKNLTNETTFTVPDCVAGEILDYKGKRGICVSSIRGVVTGDGSFSKFRLSRSPNEQYD